jgi:hypothetical protein
LHVRLQVTIGSIAAALLGFAGTDAKKEHQPTENLVEIIAMILLPVAVAMVAYALMVFIWRSKAIAKKQVQPSFDKREGQKSRKAPAYRIIPLNVTHPACGTSQRTNEKPPAQGCPEYRSSISAIWGLRSDFRCGISSPRPLSTLTSGFDSIAHLISNLPPHPGQCLQHPAQVRNLLLL